MFRLTSNITIGPYKFTGVVACKVESSWETLTDTAALTFPRKSEFKGRNIARGDNPIIQRGMPITIDLGYDDDNKRIFQGYVRSVTADIPVKIECEDKSFILKKGEITKSYKDVYLKELLNDILSSEIVIGAQPDQYRLGLLRISKATPAQIFDELKSKYSIYSWFQNDKMYCGLAYWPQTSEKHKLHFETNIIDHNLEYRNEDELQIKLKIININVKNEKKEYEFGDKEGDIRTLHYYNLPEDSIKKIADETLLKMKYSGYYGSLTTFGKPVVKHGDIVALKSDIYPERDGSYLVKKVITTYGMEGYRQEIYLDIKV